jgi:hypothetical protein
LRQGCLDELYKTIQDNICKKLGYDTVANAAKTTIEEKQLRTDAFQAIKDFSQRDTQPRAT